MYPIKINKDDLYIEIRMTAGGLYFTAFKRVDGYLVFSDNGYTTQATVDKLMAVMDV